MAGPGTKSVGPSGISISSGAICPAFAFEGLFMLSNSEASSTALIVISCAFSISP